MTDAKDEADTGQEQTMEEILASIRKIITEDEVPVVDNFKEKTKKDEQTSTVSFSDIEANNSSDDTLELTELALDKDEILEKAKGLQRLPSEPMEEGDEQLIIHLDKSMEETTEASLIGNNEKSKKSPNNPNNLPSIGATEVTSQKLSNLIEALVAKRVTSVTNRNDILDQLTKELLQPMLKDWLDVNLPLLVEDLVDKEISRLESQAQVGYSDNKK